jgi:hypothetical protein
MGLSNAFMVEEVSMFASIQLSMVTIKYWFSFTVCLLPFRFTCHESDICGDNESEVPGKIKTKYPDL